MAAADAELAEPTADTSHVGSRAGQLVSVERFLQVVDGPVPVPLPGVQDAEVFRRGGLSPRVVVLRRGLGDAARVLGDQAGGVRGRGGDGRVSGIVGGEGFGGAGGDGGQLDLAPGQCGAYQPGRGGGFAQEEPTLCREVSAVIHHKFVVTDFNGDNPLVFAGSSNLAAGGEEQNGDNLVCFTDRDIATRYAIEAIQLVDHYRFRAAMQKATDVQPLQLQPHTADWALDYYAPGSPKFRERTLVAGH